MGKFAITEYGYPDHEFRQAVLEAGFAMVQPHGHWKDPIEATIRDNPQLRELVEDAIVHFTATVPTFHKHTTDPALVVVRAVGYRAGPAGP